MAHNIKLVFLSNLIGKNAKLAGVKKSSQYAHKSGNVRVINSGASRMAYTDVDAVASIRRQVNKVNNLSIHLKILVIYLKSQHSLFSK